MPELPEVETIRQQMEKELVGDGILDVDLLDKAVFNGEPKELTNETIRSIGRVGKYLLIRFLSGKGAVVHLKMTGRIILNDPSYAKAAHTRIKIALKSGRTLYYWDTRKFGYWQPFVDIAQTESDIVKKLGPDPWHIDAITLLRRLQKTRRSIKDVLLDQTVIAGVGNIYANDALFLAGVDPRRAAITITLGQTKKILTSLGIVLSKGLSTGGASDNTYRDLYGEKGAYQNEFLVYGRTHESCLKCNRELIYIHLGGRGTWYCPKCQQ